MADFLRTRPTAGPRLRELIEAPEILRAVGAYDSLSARAAEISGAKAIYMTGYGVAASRLGRPDVGLLTMSEMAAAARAICEVVDVPVIADADTGYGNPLNVIRTVQEYERAGVAAIQLEDQTWPKKCGHMNDKEVIPTDEMCRKIEAACAARESHDFLIIARTDAIAPNDYDDAMSRARRYRDAGADILFVEALRTIDEITDAPRVLAGTPMLFNWVEGGKTPEVGFHQLAELGYALVIFPISALLAGTAALMASYASIVSGTFEAPDLDFGGFVKFIGLDEIDELNARFAND